LADDCHFHIGVDQFVVHIADVRLLNNRDYEVRKLFIVASHIRIF
jgi:chloramphenicol 3-O-phosphotransferase